MNTSTVTFRSLELPDLSGVSNDAEAREPMWPLEVWYASARDKPLAELSVNDLAVACRQRICVEYVVPFALEALRADPLAGEQYDGELIAALRHLPTVYWQGHPVEAGEFLLLARRGYEETLRQDFRTSGDEDLDFGAADLFDKPVEKDDASLSAIPRIGNGKVLGKLWQFSLTSAEMNRLADLLTQAARDRKELSILFRDIWVKFMYGSNTGTAALTEDGVLLFRSNPSDLLKLAADLRSLSAETEEWRHIHLDPAYLIPNAAVSDIVFQSADAGKSDRAAD